MTGLRNARPVVPAFRKHRCFRGILAGKRVNHAVTRPASATSVPAPSPVLQTHGLGKRFGERWILRHTELSIAAGDSIALLGESGVGKSTLLNMLAGLEPFDEGTITLGGQTLTADRFDADASARLRRECIGFVFQAFHLLPHLDVWQNVALPLLLKGEEPGKSRARAQALLARLGLAALADARPHRLSGGEQQRAALARALVHEPLLLLADEPTGNLDPQSAAVALGLMRDIVAESGCALLMVTHSDQAAAICSARWRLSNAQLLREHG